MRSKPTILLVMHTIPLDSGFLAAKFIKLSEHLNVHLLVWDDVNNINKFIRANKLSQEYKKRIHSGYTKGNTVTGMLQWVSCFFTSKVMRKYILHGNGSRIERIKYTLTYLPIIHVQPDVVHFEFGTIAKKGVAIRTFTDAKLSVSFRGYDLNYVGIDNENYYKDVWDNMDGFHFLGQDLKNRAITRGYKTNKTEALIPPGIDVGFFSPTYEIKQTDKLQLISVGRLVWKKGYEYAIRAIALLKQKGISFEYKIIGEGNHRQALEYIIKESGLENEVKLLGEKDRELIKCELAKAHIFIHPAISEGFSNAVLEAQAMALPIICTDADGLSENIADGETGYIVTKWNEQAIAEKIEMLWCNKSHLTEMGNAGAARVQQHFTIEKQMTAFIAFYHQLSDAGKS